MTGNCFFGGCCDEDTTPVFTCVGCTTFPLANLTLNWSYWQIHFVGGTTYTIQPTSSVVLPYLGPSGAAQVWESAWFLGPSDSSSCNVNPGNPTLISDCCYLKFLFRCHPFQGVSLTLNTSSVINPDGTLAGSGKVYCYDGTQPTRVGALTFTCSPFSAAYGNTGFVGDLFAGGVVTR